MVNNIIREYVWNLFFSIPVCYYTFSHSFRKLWPHKFVCCSAWPERGQGEWRSLRWPLLYLVVSWPNVLFVDLHFDKEKPLCKIKHQALVVITDTPIVPSGKNPPPASSGKKLFQSRFNSPYCVWACVAGVSWPTNSATCFNLLWGVTKKPLVSYGVLAH